MNVMKGGSMRRRIVATLLAGSLLIGSASSALAGADDRASCVGLIAADHARGIPDGMHISELVHDFQAIAVSYEIPVGMLFSSVAKLHLGSHAVCGGE
jgi:hypothetical protein